MTILDLLTDRRLVPVVVLQDPSIAKPLAKALAAGGLTLAEVTFRTRSAAQTLASMAGDPALTVGAGTIISADQVDAAVAAGARFVVSPGFSSAVVRRCQELEVPVLPGVATATELISALDAGITVVKLFPAESVGGINTLRSLAAAFPWFDSCLPEGSRRPTPRRIWPNRPSWLWAAPGWWPRRCLQSSLRPHLRPPRACRPDVRGRVRGRARRAGHDHPR
jgi:Entner-Doudoroff aldolase